MKRRFGRVAVLMGGMSSEREVSLRSGAAIAQGLREGGYDVAEVDVRDEDFCLPPGTQAAFVALHGAFGEDGRVQRILAGWGVPYTGSGAESCRIAFDKVLARERMEQAGIPVPPGEVLAQPGDRTLSFPLVVKPPREGSSVGCHLVFGESGWAAAFADAQRHSREVLAERYIPGRELTVGLVGDQVLPIVEICAAGEWYDFKAKYESGDTRYIVPAELPAETEAELAEIARETFQCLEAEGFGRVDFRLSPEGRPYVLELNSIPGFTATSLLPKAAQAAGMGFSQLCCQIVESARVK